MDFLGKNLNMNIDASIGYCIEVVGKEGQGVGKAPETDKTVMMGETTQTD